MNKIGIMAGRLSSPINNQIQCFPYHSWKDEFRLAYELGFKCIDWIVDEYIENPILDDTSLLQIKELSQEVPIEINTICADYFLFQKLFHEEATNIEKNLEFLKKIIYQAKKLEVKTIEIPFVDNSSLKSNNDKQELVTNLEKITPLLEETQLKLALETDLDIMALVDLLNEINHPNILLNYDVGNSTSLGYDIKTEWDALSKYFISVHVKDRKIGGSTVPLGTGDVNFKVFFDMVKKSNYSYDLIIQGAREDLDSKKISHIETCQKYLKFVKQYLD